MHRIYLLLSVLCLPFWAIATTTWTGMNSTSFIDPANWDNGLPTASNNAIIPLGVANNNFPVISTNLSLNYDLTLESTLSINNAAMVTFMGNVFTNSGQLFLEEGTAFMIETGTFTNAMGAAITNSGTVANFANWSNAGNIQSDGMLMNSGTLTNLASGLITSNGSITNNSDLVNEGQLFNNQGLLTNNGAFTNAFQLLNFAPIINNGTLSCSDNSVIISSISFINNGQISITDGTTFQNQGSFENTPGSACMINATIENTGTFVNSGVISILGAGSLNNFVSLINNGNIDNMGILFTALCAVTQNNGSIQNDAFVNNSGIIEQFPGAEFTGNNIVNTGGFTIVNGQGDFCQNATVNLLDNQSALLLPALDLVDASFSLCSDFTVTYENGASSQIFTCSSIGEQTLEISVNDQLDNTFTCTTSVFVTSDAPEEIIICPSDLTIETDAGLCTAANIGIGEPFVQNICGGMATFTNNAPSVFELGTTTVVWSNGTETVCTQTVTVEASSMSGSITCPDDVNLVSDNGLCTASNVDLGMPTGTDMCGNVLTFTNNAPAIFEIGNTIVEWSDGAEIVCTQNVMVLANDGEVPTDITCPSDVITMADLGNCTAANVDLGAPISGDLCGGMPAMFSNNAPNSFAVGSTSFMWTVETMDGTEPVCEQTVTVNDLQNPLLDCTPNVTFSLDNDCNIPSIMLTAPTASDNCGLESLTNDAPNSFPMGTTIVTWTATDLNSNSSLCLQNISVIDDVAPTFTNCPDDITVSTALFACEAIATWNAPTASDNCQLENMTESAPSGTTFDIGTQLVQYLATDAAGNTNACIFSVNIVDNTPLVLTNCPTDIEVNIAGNINWTAPTFSGGCAATLTSDIENGAFFDEGETTVTYTANNTNGNSTNCSFTVTVTTPIIDVETLQCVENIAAAIENIDDISAAYWNVPNIESTCDYCNDTDIEGYTYLGDFAGHQYFLYHADRMLWFDAAILIEDQVGYLAQIDNAAENAFLTQRLVGVEPAAWIGLSDWQSEGEYVWQNGETATYTNWADNYPRATSFYNFAVLTGEGTWEDISGFMNNYFILERPCIDIRPMGNAINAGDFEAGTHTISYLISDPCGDEYVCAFDINVETDNVDYCTISGDGNIYIDSLETMGYLAASGNNDGYSDQTNDIMSLINDDCLLYLTPGGQAADEVVFWRVWVDFNKDGDFFDEGELSIERWAQGTTLDYLNLPAYLSIPTGELRMRVAASRYDYVNPCGDFSNGEIEDYTISITSGTQALCIPNTPTFIAQSFDREVHLNWLINENCPIQHYELEKSLDGVNFELINTLPAWNTRETAELYQSFDPNPSLGDNYYRLKTVYQGDNYFYSDIKHLYWGRDMASFHLFPNPTMDYIYVHLGDLQGKAGTLQVVNNFGQIIYQKVITEDMEDDLQIDMRQQRAGLYSIALKVEGILLQTRNFVFKN